MIEFCSKIRDSRWFDNAIFIVIILAGILVGIETFPNFNNNFGLAIRIANELILAIFVLEIVIRTIAEINKPLRLLTDAWYIFDFVIVAICFLPYFVDNFQTSFFLVLRLARVLRMIRIFERIHTLQILIDSLVRSIPSMTYVNILLFLQFYIYAVIGTDLFGKYAPNEFGTIFLTMKALILVVFEGWSWVYDLPGIDEALSNGLSDSIIVFYFISFIFIASVIFLNLFIGILTNEISVSKFENQNANKKLKLTNHTLILGWSEKIYSIVANLVVANESESKSSIVILADKNKKDMAEDLGLQVKNYKYTKMIFREGLPTNTEYLKLVSPECAKSIVILSQNENETYGDINSIMQILTLMHLNSGHTNFNIIANIDSSDNIRLAKKLIGDNGCIVSTEEVVAKVLAQICVNKHLYSIYEEIVGFEGNELYILENPLLFNKTFAEILFMYDNSVPIGVFQQDGTILICPDKDYCFSESDSIIILSEDDSTAIINKGSLSTKINTEYSFTPKLNIDSYKKLQKVLILGWNQKSITIIDELYSYLLEGSQIHIISDNINIEDLNIILEKFQNNNIALSYSNGRVDNYKNLSNYNIHLFDSILVLSNYEENDNYQECDTHTMIELINITAIQKEQNLDFNIIAEILSKGNQDLAKLQKIADFVIGPDFVSSLISMVAENKDIYDVYVELFSNYGAGIFVRDLSLYSNSQDMTFANLTKSALQINEIAIGYILSDGKTVINPAKSDIISIEDNMKLIVVTENHNIAHY